MRVITKIIAGLIALVLVFVIAIAVAAMTIDINQYREQIAAALSKQTGRTVKLAGDIHFAATSHGVGITVEKASIGNPSWASRPEMASIGKLDIGVALLPLLERKIVITELDISNADILLETNASNQNNWDMKPAAAPSPENAKAASATSNQSTQPVGIRVDELSVMNSQLAMRDKEGKVSTFKVDKMTLSPQARGIAIALAADYNGTPLKVTLNTGTSDLMTTNKWPYDADVTYADYHLKAQGNASLGSKTADLSPYEFSMGSTTFHGQLSTSFGGPRTEVHGSLQADKVDLSALKSEAPAGGERSAQAEAPAPETGEAKPLFSTTPLNVSALRSANANIDVSIGEVAMSKITLKQLTTKLVLANGNLTIEPFKAMLDNSELQGNLRLEASSPPRYSMSLKAPGVDIASLLQMLDTRAFLSGKGNADIELSGAGASPHDMASNTNGHIDITVTGGQVSSSEANGVASGLAQLFAPGSSNPSLNCVAARFVVSNGVAKDNGILADSSASTVAGSGGFDLGKETIGITLNAKPKLVNTRGLLPAVQIGGSLTKPSFGVDTASAVQNAAGVLLKDKKIGGTTIGNLLGGGGSNAESGVPTILAAPAGENACIYTLDHKTAATAQSPQPQGNNAVQDVAGQSKTKVKDIGNQLLQGLFGHK